MRHFSWIILLPLAAFAVAFAVVNRDTVPIDLWPFPFVLEVPLFAVVFAGLLVGVLWGGIAAWLSAGRARRTARAKTHEAERLAAETGRLRERIAELEAEGHETAPAGKALQAGGDTRPDRLPPPAA